MTCGMNQEDFFHELYERYYLHLRNYCIVLFHYDPQLIPLADDCVQEVFAAALKHPQEVIDAPNTYAWLAKCCKNTCYAVLRKKALTYRKLGKQISFDEVYDFSDSTDGIIRWLCQYQALELLNTIYDCLTPLEQAVFQDYYQKGMSAKMTAAHNGVSLYSVKGTLSRLRSKAMRIVREYFSEQ